MGSTGYRSATATLAWLFTVIVAGGCRRVPFRCDPNQPQACDYRGTPGRCVKAPDGEYRCGFIKRGCDGVELDESAGKALAGTCVPLPGMPDLGMEVDLGMPPDLSVPPDVKLPDFALEKDFAMSPDLSLPSDLAMPDLGMEKELGMPPDLSVSPDQSVPPDLKVPDFAMGKDLALPPDLSVPPDLSMPRCGKAGEPCCANNACAEGVCQGGRCEPPSCQGLAASCGPNGNESCCTSLLVRGGMYFRSYDGLTYKDKSWPATVSDFKLDKYEITIGRFRKFIAAGKGVQGAAPAAGDGRRMLNGMPDQGGWEGPWGANLEANTADLKSALSGKPTPVTMGGGECGVTYAVWSEPAMGNEARPINCITWYEATAFCLWDGGFLPTEAEWNYAAAGGGEQREYPWVGAFNASYANHACLGDGNPNCWLTDIVGVGKFPDGNGRWGQADLAGSMWEWNLDWWSPSGQYPMPQCNNCTNLQVAAYRVFRGGSFGGDTSYLRAANRGYNAPATRSHFEGARCARTP